MLIVPPVIQGILLGLGTRLVLMFNWVMAIFPTIWLLFSSDVVHW